MVSLGLDLGWLTLKGGEFRLVSAFPMVSLGLVLGWLTLKGGAFRLVSAFPMVSLGLVLGWLTLKGGEFRLVSAISMVSFGLVWGWLTLKGGELRCGDVAKRCAHEWAVMGFGCVRIFVCSNRCRRTSSTYPSRVLPTPFSRNIGLCRHGGRDVSAAPGTKCGDGRCGYHFCLGAVVQSDAIALGLICSWARSAMVSRCGTLLLHLMESKVMESLWALMEIGTFCLVGPPLAPPRGRGDRNAS